MDIGLGRNKLDHVLSGFRLRLISIVLIANQLDVGPRCCGVSTGFSAASVLVVRLKNHTILLTSAAFE